PVDTSQHHTIECSQHSRGDQRKHAQSRYSHARESRCIPARSNEVQPSTERRMPEHIPHRDTTDQNKPEADLETEEITSHEVGKPSRDATNRRASDAECEASEQGPDS